MTPTATPGELRWRLDAVEREAKELESLVRDNTKVIGKVRSDIDLIRFELRQLTERTRAFTRALWATAGSLVVFAVSILVGPRRPA